MWLVYDDQIVTMQSAKVSDCPNNIIPVYEHAM
jgi:hypothetical protein